MTLSASRQIIFCLSIWYLCVCLSVCPSINVTVSTQGLQEEEEDEQGEKKEKAERRVRLKSI